MKSPFRELKVILTVLFSLLSITGCNNSSANIKSLQRNDIELQIDSILNKMSIEEKIGQLALRGTSSSEKGELPEELLSSVRNGEIGAFLNVMDTANMRKLQQIAVNESKHGIPLIFARDVIHGFKTIFPIPLGQAASWNPEIVEEGSRVAALEASSVGIRWTFAPMLDICRDSRWGRIAESPGEDPYLASVLAKAYVKGFQGDDLSDPTRIAACAKHFIGYGAAIGGRDYNTAIISTEQLYNTYLPPFKEAVQYDVATFMSSFNEVNGIPATGNKKLLTDILRTELGFDGFVVSDWNSVTEMIDHGFAKDRKHAAELAARAGLDMEMTSRAYELYLKDLIKEGIISKEQLDFYVKNILRIKFRMGLFENPYIPENHPGTFYAKENLEKAKKAAIESTVLLKNNGILPLESDAKILLTGPLANKGREQLGTWTFDGEGEPSITPKEAMEEALFVEGLSYSRDKNIENLDKVIAAARKSEIIVFIGGEEAILSGEAHSRASIKLPGAQEELLTELYKLDKPLILVIMAGRPINITNYIDELDAVLMMWHPGTMGGPALKDMIYGISEPSGRLPVSWPKAAGQLPYFYNHKRTGRPANPDKFVSMEDIPVGAWQSSLGNESHYLDLGYAPLFPFGYGLSYGEIEYGEISISDKEISNGEDFIVSVKITNTSNRNTSEVVQLYAHDKVGRITRPVKELKKFNKIELKPGENKRIEFKLNYEDFKYYDNEGRLSLESGEIDLFIGNNSNTKNKATINIL
ncbi:glycoside hydrolase family 3 C-terminal domain-containing protein [Mangrovivirga sp. M17]|uniref:beta-glucosidase n=1 Tax=Mangrovivirga halotolerans TaxID=2993936 RepID=A0ABT3RVZ0_9BACT|nr:glycoside hydrolase family 3 N-terminal domain-containing protein [Mangrovivirga halotolerans]MCX2745524.1 glycoside hydrolase family 3 C-terminal domain-containing protein [Mangrovivirga halotolerans]